MKSADQGIRAVAFRFGCEPLDERADDHAAQRRREQDERDAVRADDRLGRATFARQPRRDVARDAAQKYASRDLEQEVEQLRRGDACHSEQRGVEEQSTLADEMAPNELLAV